MSLKVIEIKSWKEYVEVITNSDFKSWAFRGQTDTDWPLLSTLSRYFKTFKVHPDAWQQQESRILRIFKRKSHLFLSQIPEPDDSFQWLALMQHFGTPTRLLDFTWSPYVSAFFALEKATNDSAIWAVFPPGLADTKIRTTRASQKLGSDEIGPWIFGNYEKYFLPNTYNFVTIGEPHKMNQRLIAQSGTFVIPGRLDNPIESIVKDNSIVKFVLKTSELRKTAMSELYKMNISNATLFPGLDGLARSLAYELEFHWAFDPTNMQPYDGFHID